MPTLPKPPQAPIGPTVSDAGHWYDWGGNPQHTYINTKGERSNTTLRHAKKANFLPSFSGVCQAMAKPGLESYKIKQVLYAALTLPQEPDESLDDYARRVIEDSEKHRDEAAETGTAIHLGIEAELGGTETGDVTNEVAAAAIEEFHGVPRDLIVCEKTFAHELGWGGTCDQHVPGDFGDTGADTPSISDVKTKDFTAFDKFCCEERDAGKKPMQIARAHQAATGGDLDDIYKRVNQALRKLKLYEQHFMQLGAYREGLDIPTARGAIVFVSTVEPGLVYVAKAADEDLQHGWEMFRTLLEFWKAAKRYDPVKMKEQTNAETT